MNAPKLKPIDLTKVLRPFKDQWVALSMDYKKVLGAGKTLEQAKKMADKTGEKYTFYKNTPYPFINVPLVKMK